MRDWLVAAGLVVSDGAVLLVQNRRRDGRVDWSPPGGVIDPGESVIGGLTREVTEETGLRVVEWQGPSYLVKAEAPDMGWRLAVEVHLAVTYEGELTLDDPDGIVVDARFVEADECAALLTAAPRWVSEPVCDWLTDPRDEAGAGDGAGTYEYRVGGTLAGGDIQIDRIESH